MGRRDRNRVEDTSPKPSPSSIRAAAIEKAKGGKNRNPFKENRSAIELNAAIPYLLQTVPLGSLKHFHESTLLVALKRLKAEPDSGKAIIVTDASPAQGGNMRGIERFVSLTDDVEAVQCLEAVVRQRLVETGQLK